MKGFFFLAVILLPISVFALVCDHSNPHPSSNNCMRKECGNDELCQQCCDEICIQCHTPPTEEPNLSDPTPWNPEAANMTEIWPETTEETMLNLADVCSNCHGGYPEEDRFAEGHNHPVDVFYDDGKLHTDLVSSPEGPLLICAEGTTDCMVRCITCHVLHPDSESRAEEPGLLRISNQGSALCIACHRK